jgi:hypothetical protein
MAAEATITVSPESPELSRPELVEPGYSWRWHALRTLTLATLIGAFGLYLARSASLLDWLFAPIFFVAANAIEWTVHRGPMHRLVGPRFFYKNHTLLHHRAFLHDHMEVDDMRELSLIMMPWYTMLLIFGIASPIALLAGAIRGPAVAGMFFLVAALYFLLYESLHALYHMPAPLLGRLHLQGRVFRWLQAHHTHHHRLDRMSKTNFNVTLPLMDWLMQTNENPRNTPTVLERPRKRPPV